MEANRPSRAKEYFDEIKRPENGVEFLKRLVEAETQTFESEFLDFKGGQELDVSSKDLLELWAKNLSCFANSDGGVLVFGIAAPKGVAKSLSLVKDVDALQDRLKNLLPKITEPPVQRVEIEIYRVQPSSNAGFVVCYIPASPWRPHQVRTDGQPGQFYIRAADNCIPCNHSTLRALFAPQPVSRLVLSYKVLVGRPSPDQNIQEVHLSCWLENTGPATASEIFLSYNSYPRISEPQFSRNILEETSSKPPLRSYLAKRSLHPEETLQLFSFKLGVLKNGQKMFSNDPKTFTFSVSAKNQSPTKFEISILPQDIEDESAKQARLLG